MPSAKVRFIAKAYGKKWRVYDLVTASYPVSRKEFDSALPTFDTEGECQTVAESLQSQVQK